MNRLLVLLMSLLLALPVQALDLQGLYEQALTASRQGDFVEALPLWAVSYTHLRAHET